jgi:hypothetical protein
MRHYIPSSHQYSIRIVIQRIGGGRGTTWRVLGYGGNRAFGYSDFSSPEGLLSTLQGAIPDFDGATFSLDELAEGASSIVYTCDMELSYPQLAVLGLG